jgi:hypothetical protein
MTTFQPSPTPDRVIGFAPDGQPFTSALAEDFFCLLRFNRRIARWERPAEPVVWFSESRARHEYTPDALVYFRPDMDGTTPRPLLCEVQWSQDDDAEERPRRGRTKKLRGGDREVRQEATRLHARRRGWGFEIFDEAFIRTDYLRNVKFLLRHLEREVIDRGSDKAIEILQRQDQMPLQALLDALAPDVYGRARVAPTVYLMIADGSIECDLQKPFRMDTMLWLPTGAWS